MSVPTHGPDCRTRMWGTKCRDCDHAVYFFSCDCGSRVLFEYPGPPWPPHECVGYTFRTFRDTGAGPIEARDLTYDYANQIGLRVEDEVMARLVREARREDTGRSVQEVQPGEEKSTFVGVVRELNPNVNFRKRFRMVDSPLSKALLGRLGSGTFSELRVKEESDAVSGIIGEIRAFVPATLVTDSGLRIGMMVAIEVEPCFLPGGRKVWTVTEVFRVGS